VVEGTTFGQLRQRLANDPNVMHTLNGLDQQQLLKKLEINQTHPEGWFAPDTYYFAKGETDATILKHLYRTQKRLLTKLGKSVPQTYPIKMPMRR
jgi:UPF0755 protein